MIEEYEELHTMMLERADHISKIFDEVDEEMEWWQVKERIDYDVTFSCGSDAVVVTWSYPDPCDYRYHDENHYWAFPRDFFESATDDELREYALIEIDKQRVKNEKDSIRSVLYGLHGNRDFIEFMQTVTLPDQMYAAESDKIIGNYLAWKTSKLHRDYLRR